MKLSIVFSVHNQFPLARTAIRYATQNLSRESDAELLIIDNASDTPLVEQFLPNERQINHRLEENIGVYPLFWSESLKHTFGDVIAFLHSDLIITEKDWDVHVLEQFANNPRLGLLGFIGSNQIDKSGGRGLGTTSNFQGNLFTEEYGVAGETKWKGSAAEIHGARDAAFTPAAVVDGCAMIFRREVLEQIKQRSHFPPHHFYDRLLSCEVREKGYKIGVLGISCDHISGQTVNQEPGYNIMAQKWAAEHGFDKTKPEHNWDTVLYKEAERQWLSEYRDKKHMVPYFV